mmetsp:Transcript_44384/g.84874  ORF Transcript_44384/g.84874 Transcript_44384/m.84874 type:complete len:334 (-) Transcript_44384:683-1684(-)
MKKWPLNRSWRVLHAISGPSCKSRRMSPGTHGFNPPDPGVIRRPHACVPWSLCTWHHRRLQLVRVRRTRAVRMNGLTNPRLPAPNIAHPFRRKLAQSRNRVGFSHAVVLADVAQRVHLVDHGRDPVDFALLVQDAILLHAFSCFLSYRLAVELRAGKLRVLVAVLLGVHVVLGPIVLLLAALQAEPCLGFRGALPLLQLDDACSAGDARQRARGAVARLASVGQAHAVVLADEVVHVVVPTVDGLHAGGAQRGEAGGVEERALHPRPARALELIPSLVPHGYKLLGRDVLKGQAGDPRHELSLLRHPSQCRGMYASPTVGHALAPDGFGVYAP